LHGGNSVGRRPTLLRFEIAVNVLLPADIY
jgi:hypothetical protein